MIHYFDAAKQVLSRVPIKKGGKPRVKATKKGSYLDFYTKQNFKLYPKAKFYETSSCFKSKEKNPIKVSKTKLKTFMDNVLYYNTELKVVF